MLWFTFLCTLFSPSSSPSPINLHPNVVHWTSVRGFLALLFFANTANKTHSWRWILPNCLLLFLWHITELRLRVQSSFHASHFLFCPELGFIWRVIESWQPSTDQQWLLGSQDFSFIVTNVFIFAYTAFGIHWRSMDILWLKRRLCFYNFAICAVNWLCTLVECQLCRETRSLYILYTAELMVYDSVDTNHNTLRNLHYFNHFLLYSLRMGAWLS